MSLAVLSVEEVLRRSLSPQAEVEAQDLQLLEQAPVEPVVEVVVVEPVVEPVVE